uniref:Uncharacterized protein n=1 Tax=Parascaris univalens TaxID=6257 RepID=A0A915C3K7_PARUN
SYINYVFNVGLCRLRRNNPSFFLYSTIVCNEEQHKSSEWRKQPIYTSNRKVNHPFAGVTHVTDCSEIHCRQNSPNGRRKCAPLCNSPFPKLSTNFTETSNLASSFRKHSMLQVI